MKKRLKKEKNTGKREFPQTKKDIKTFLLSEEGKVTKKSAARLGLTFLAIGAAVSGLMKADSSKAACSHVSHTSHSSHGSHGSHSSHGSHLNY